MHEASRIAALIITRDETRIRRDVKLIFDFYLKENAWIVAWIEEGKGEAGRRFSLARRSTSFNNNTAVIHTARAIFLYIAVYDRFKLPLRSWSVDSA